MVDSMRAPSPGRRLAALGRDARAQARLRRLGKPWRREAHGPLEGPTGLQAGRERPTRQTAHPDARDRGINHPLLTDIRDVASPVTRGRAGQVRPLRGVGVEAEGSRRRAGEDERGGEPARVSARRDPARVGARGVEAASGRPSAGEDARVLVDAQPPERRRDPGRHAHGEGLAAPLDPAAGLPGHLDHLGDRAPADTQLETPGADDVPGPGARRLAVHWTTSVSDHVTRSGG